VNKVTNKLQSFRAKALLSFVINPRPKGRGYNNK